MLSDACAQGIEPDASPRQQALLFTPLLQMEPSVGEEDLPELLQQAGGQARYSARECLGCSEKSGRAGAEMAGKLERGGLWKGDGSVLRSTGVSPCATRPARLSQGHLKNQHMEHSWPHASFTSFLCNPTYP